MRSSTSPSQVAQRIVNCLRDRSIYTTFDTDNATAMGTNLDHVELCIKLFRAPEDGVSINSSSKTFEKSNSDTALETNAPNNEFLEALDGKPKSFSGMGVVVEVTRKRGCTMSFHNDCRAILSAARGYRVKRSSASLGLDPEDNDSSHRGGGRPGRRFRASLSRSQSMPAVSLTPVAYIAARAAAATESSLSDGDDATHPTPDENVMLALENVEELLKKDRMDANLLGMQSLYMITSTSPGGEKDRSAAYAARMVLLRHDYDGMSETPSSILSMVETLVREWTLNTDEEDNMRTESSDDEMIAGELPEERSSSFAVGGSASAAMSAVSSRYDDYYASTMHNLALGVLSNILTHTAADNETRWDSLPMQIQVWIQSNVLPTILHEMRLAVSAASDPSFNTGNRTTRMARPHDATLAIRALIAIMALSPDMRTIATDMGALNLLMILRSMGVALHAVLAEDCERALRMMGESVAEEEDSGSRSGDFDDDDDRKISATGK